MRYLHGERGMTTEIAVMNKEAVALAADSAASILRNREVKKIYNANKLFMFSKTRPIGIMFYNNTELNLVPWETIIKAYRDLPAKQFDTLKEYSDHFISFLNNADNPYYTEMFPTIMQDSFFTALTKREFKKIAENIDEQIKSLAKGDGEIKEEKMIEIVSAAIQEKYDESVKLNMLGTVPENYNLEMLEKYGDKILSCKDDIFKSLPITETSLTQLKEIGCNIIIKDHFFFLSGVVIAGFGDKEIFPSLVSYSIDFIFNNKLKYREDKSIKITHLKDASIETFAQDETIDAFLFGVHPKYNDELSSALKKLITTEIPEKLLDQIAMDESDKISHREKMMKLGHDIYKKFFSDMAKQCGSHFTPCVFG